MSAWRNDAGQVRSGWVVLAFVGFAGVGSLVMGIAVGAVLFIAARTTGGGIVGIGLHTPISADEWELILSSWPFLSAGVLGSVACHLIFKEKVGLSRERMGKLLGLGLALGLGMLTLAVVVPTSVGAGTLALTTLPATAVLGGIGMHFVVLAPQSVAEELLLRGVPLQALSRGIHRVPAAILTSAIFGVLHLTNPNASWVGAANVALVGLWFAALTLRTGSLWCSIGLHVAWNFSEGVVFGQPVSGLMPGRSLLAATWPHAASFWSGGDFGPEASGWTTVLLVVATAVTVLWPKRRAPLGPSEVEGRATTPAG